MYKYAIIVFAVILFVSFLLGMIVPTILFGAGNMEMRYYMSLITFFVLTSTIALLRLYNSVFENTRMGYKLGMSYRRIEANFKLLTKALEELPRLTKTMNNLGKNVKENTDTLKTYSDVTGKNRREQ